MGNDSCKYWYVVLPRSCKLSILHIILEDLDCRCLHPEDDDIIKTTRPHFCFFSASSSPLSLNSDSRILSHNSPSQRLNHGSTQENSQVTEDVHVHS